MKAEFKDRFIFFGRDSGAYGTSRPDGPSFMGVWDGCYGKSYADSLVVNQGGFTYSRSELGGSYRKWFSVVPTGLLTSSIDKTTEAAYAWCESRGIDLEDMSDEDFLVFRVEFCAQVQS